MNLLILKLHKILIESFIYYWDTVTQKQESIRQVKGSGGHFDWKLHHPCRYGKFQKQSTYATTAPCFWNIIMKLSSDIVNIHKALIKNSTYNNIRHSLQLTERIHHLVTILDSILPASLFFIWLWIAVKLFNVSKYAQVNIKKALNKNIEKTTIKKDQVMVCIIAQLICLCVKFGFTCK